MEVGDIAVAISRTVGVILEEVARPPTDDHLRGRRTVCDVTRETQADLIADVVSPPIREELTVERIVVPPGPLERSPDTPDPSLTLHRYQLTLASGTEAGPEGLTQMGPSLDDGGTGVEVRWRDPRPLQGLVESDGLGGGSPFGGR